MRETLKNILELTGLITRQLRAAGEDGKAKSLILWVATCLHVILVKKEKLYRENPFTPSKVKAGYHETRYQAEKRKRDSSNFFH